MTPHMEAAYKTWFKRTMWCSRYSIILITILSLYACNFFHSNADNAIIVVGSTHLDSDTLKKDVRFICSESPLPFQGEPRIKEKLIERVIDHYLVLEFGKKNGIVISQKEFEENLGEIKKQYNDETFREAMLQAYVSEEQWELRFKESLLIRKINIEFMKKVLPPTYEEAKQFFEKNQDRFTNDGKLEDVYPEVTTILTRKKRYRFYTNWLKELRSQFQIRVNQELLKQVEFS